MNNQNGYYGQPNNNQNGYYGQNGSYPYGQPNGQPMNNQPMNNQGYYGQSGMRIGQPNRIVNYPQNQNVPNNTPNPSDKKKNKKIWIIAFIVVLLVVAVVVAGIFLFGNKKTGGNKKKPPKREISMERTTMIYMVGSDLENFGNASAELNHIRPNNIDLENQNIVLIAGGSKVWGTEFIDPNETSIYQLKESGFEKVKQEKLKNMGEADTLSNFLDYVYENYPAKKYELIFWNHGVGIEGIAYDNISEDILTLEELKEALSKSFFQEEKLDSILFMNSLLGSLEIASIVDDYANYMVASEEIAYSHPFIDKFRFLEEVEKNDTGLEFGRRFIDNLSKNNYLKSNSKYYHTPITYSIIDLSKVSEIEKKLVDFVKKIKVSEDYDDIALARAKTIQYGGETTSYDMVDLYSLTSNMQSLGQSEAKSLMNAITDSVVYNYSSDKESKGISIYFPYYDVESSVKKKLESLETLENNKDYVAFIQDFDSHRRKHQNTIDLKFNDIVENAIVLTEEQESKIVKSSYIIVKESNDGNFTPLYFSDNITIDNHTLKANFDGNVVAALDTKTNEVIPITASEDKKGNYLITIQLQKADKSAIVDASAYVEIKNNSGKLGMAIQNNNIDKLEVSLPSMSILTLESYQDVIFINQDYRILDSNGDVLKKWQPMGDAIRVNALVNHYRIQKQAIPKDGKYYLIYKVTDASNQVSYSKMIALK